MELKHFITIADWHERNRCGALPTRASVDWLIKQHRQELCARDVLIPGRGRAGSLVHAAEFGVVALDIVRRERVAA